jgi:hypothetical protein
MEHKQNAIFEGTDNPEGFRVSKDCYKNASAIHNLFFNNTHVYY